MRTNVLRPALLALLALAAAFGLALSACGDDDGDSTDADLGPDPATMAPADAPFYGEAVVRPEGAMLEDFNSTFSKLLGTEDPSAMLTEELETALAEEDLSYSEDIEPWLGARIGGFVTDYDPATKQAEGAVAVAITDADSAQAFLDKAAATSETPAAEKTYNGADYMFADQVAIGISGDFLVAGTEQGFMDAIDAGAGDSLAENSDASASRDEIPDDSLFSAYVDTQAVIDLVETSGALSPEQLQQFRDQIAQYAEGAVDVWGTVGESSIEFAFSAPAMTDAPEPTDLVSSFPAESWLAVAAGDVGEQLQTTIDQFEQGLQAGFEEAAPRGFPSTSVDPLAELRRATGLDLRTDFDWIGDVGAYVEGTSVFGLGAAVVLEATDEAAASKTVDKLQAALGKEPSLGVTPTDDGFEIQVPPASAEVAVRDGKLVLAAGAATVDEALSPDSTLDGSDRFGTAREALGDDLVPSFYLDFLPVVQLIESIPEAGSDPDYQGAKPYIDALDYLAAGSKLDGDRAFGSIVLGVREAPAGGEETSAAALVP